MEVITSRSNPLVKWVASLHDKKGRRAEHSFIAEGVKLTLEAIVSGMAISHILISEAARDAVLSVIVPELKARGIDDCPIHILSETAFEKVSTEKAPQGVITVIKYLDFSINPDIIYKEEFFIKHDERVLALYSVRDPSNLGAVIRSAVAFGVDRILLSDDCADVYSPKAVRSAMGGIFKVKISEVSDFSAFISAARNSGRRVFAAELTKGARSLRDVCLKPSDIIIIGNEGHGIPGDISALCDASLYIPIAPSVESLNASVAAAIFMWEQGKK